jgi:hypothetical protein
MQFALISNSPFEFEPRVHLSNKKADEYIVNLQSKINNRKVAQDAPDIKAIEIVEVPMENNRNSRKSNKSAASSSSTTIDPHWALKYKGLNANFFVVNPRDDPNSEQLTMLTYGEGNRTKNFEDERYINLFKKEREFL